MVPTLGVWIIHEGQIRDLAGNASPIEIRNEYDAIAAHDRVLAGEKNNPHPE
jgi:hypothetical protein